MTNRTNNKKFKRAIKEIKDAGFKFIGFAHRKHRTNKKKKVDNSVKHIKLQKIKDKEYKKDLKRNL